MSIGPAKRLHQRVVSAVEHLAELIESFKTSLPLSEYSCLSYYACLSAVLKFANINGALLSDEPSAITGGRR